jgi:hypothetical protein
VAVPDTVLEGSDLVELLAWACLGIPGLLYCWWRHSTRIKVCSHCGSPELMRETRAMALRHPPDALPTSGPHIRNLSGRERWPRPLRPPRTRLWTGGVGALFVSVALAAWLLAALDFAERDTARTIVQASLLLGFAWLVHQIVRVSRVGAILRGCRAWDERGRLLRIELI